MQAFWILIGMAIAFGSLLFILRLPLPLVFIGTSVVGAVLGGFGIAPLHLVEGLFGYIYPILVLLSGAVFHRWMKASGVSEAIVDTLWRWCKGHYTALLLVASALIYVSGMFTGMAGAAVLFAGAVAVPIYRRLGMSPSRAAALLAITAIVGMVGPPVNLPAAMIADGVNMPYSEFTWILLAISLPVGLFAVWYIGRPKMGMSVAESLGRSETAASATEPAHAPDTSGRSLLPLAAVVIPLAIWIAVRLLPATFSDPSIPLVFIAGALTTLLVRRKRFDPLKTAYHELGGTVLHLGSVLAAVGILVQIMTLTGVRGWIVINSMSLNPPWTYLAILLTMPLLGGTLTSLGAASVLGVPFAFIFIERDMIANAAALSLMSGLAEMMPPTSIAAILSGYLAGDMRLRPIWRYAAVPMVAIAVVSILALIFSSQLGIWLR